VINKSILLCLLIISTHLAIAQVSMNSDASINELIEGLLQQQEEGISYEDVYETLFQYYNEPLDINNASKEELLQLYILSPLQVNALIEHRKKTGPIISLYELQTIPTLDKNTIQKLLHFISISSEDKQLKKLINKMITNSNHYLITRYGKIKTDPSSNYLGDGHQIHIRYRNASTKDFSYGITMEKDGGERIIWNPSKKYYGFDFLSYHFSLFNKGKIKALTIGDYQIQFGQGLVLSAGFRLGKGGETVLTVKRNNGGLKPYSSGLEYGYFRGAFVSTTAGPTDISLFYSNKNIDGTISENESIFSQVKTGYHRTVAELSKRFVVNEQILGGNISYQKLIKNFHAGLTMVGTLFDYNLKKSDALYNYYEFSGNNNFTTGVDVSYSYLNYSFFGESAISKSGGKGIVAGVLTSLSKNFDASLIYRNYEKNFHSFYSSSFGENSRNINESGIYTGLKYKINSKWVVGCFYDRYKFPWLKYLVDAPSTGEEYLIRLSYQPNKTSLTYLQIKNEVKELNLAGNTNKIDYPVTTNKRNFLIQTEVKASQSLTTRTRVQVNTYQQNHLTTGYAIVQDLDWKTNRFAVSFRYSLFDTDDYDNRIYMYEKDVLYSFSIPSYFGKGTRIYGIIKFKILKNIDTWIKYSKTTYWDKKAVNDNEVTSIQLSDFRIQLRYLFH
jgi:hypothetical protein